MMKQSVDFVAVLKAEILTEISRILLMIRTILNSVVQSGLLTEMSWL